MQDGSPSAARPYKGRTADERREERRRRLLAAGLELWGDHGWAAVSMRGVCAHAGLNDRYFYESFADVESLLLAVYDQALDALVAHLDNALASSADPREQIRAGMTAFVRAMADDPRRARIGLAEPAGSPALERRRRATYRLFAARARTSLVPADGPGFNGPGFTRAALFALGGVAELVITWLTEPDPGDPGVLAAHASELTLTVLDPYLP
ncbi:TetR/AcrR family transcriptional regulator [Actinocorallia longicatena]